MVLIITTWERGDLSKSQNRPLPVRGVRVRCACVVRVRSACVVRAPARA
jgi:hypothetical protein